MRKGEREKSGGREERKRKGRKRKEEGPYCPVLLALGWPDRGPLESSFSAVTQRGFLDPLWSPLVCCFPDKLYYGTFGKLDSIALSR
jgi:hypothetical protein